MGFGFVPVIPTFDCSYPPSLGEKRREKNEFNSQLFGYKVPRLQRERKPGYPSIITSQALKRRPIGLNSAFEMSSHKM